MPRDSNGVYTLPLSVPQPGTKISSSWMNTTLNDIAAALTASLSIDGSVTPEHLADDPTGFQTKLNLGGILSSVSARVDALVSRNDAEIGSISSHGATDPDHFLPCDGSQVSRTTYAKLFAKIGTTFGAGNGSTTFTLPNLQREWSMGRSASRAVGAKQAGTTVPAHTHTGTTASAGAHTHGGSSSSNGAHTHTWSVNTGSNNVGHTHTFSATTNSTGAHTHTVSYGLMSMHDQNHHALVAGSGSNYTGSSSGAHTHTISGTTGGQSANHTHTYSFTSATNGAHTHSLSVSSAGAHAHAMTTNTTGAHTHSVTLDSTGTTENRVRCVYVPLYIKYE